MKTFLQKALSICMFLLVFVLVLDQQIEAQTYYANLSGSHEVPPVTTTATGTVTAELNGTTLVVTGSFQGLSSNFNTDIAGGAHLHSALAGSNAGIAISLNASIDADQRGGEFLEADNTFELSQEEIDLLKSRSLYVNIHSVQYPGGELRGQLQPDADAWFRANLSGNNEVPSIKTRAHGSTVFELIGDSLFVSGSFQNLSSDFAFDVAGGAHLHMGLAGSNGGISIPLNATVSDDNRSGTFQVENNGFELTQEQKQALNERKFYVNIHSVNFLPGELRGQVVPQTTATFIANLGGSSQNGPVRSSGVGALVLELDGDSLKASGSFSNLSSNFNADVAGGAHLHTAPAGRNGGIAIPINTETSDDLRSGTYSIADNSFELTAEQKTVLLDRQMYVNIHSTDYIPGEIRGQVLPEAHVYLHAELSSINEVPFIQTEASGKGLITVSGTNITVSGAFQGLSSPFAFQVAGGAHLHEAGITSNGGIAIPLTPNVEEGDTSGVFGNEQIEATSDQIEALLNGQMYFNIHSETYLSGELRGQVLGLPNSFPDSAVISSPAEGADLDVSGEATNTLTVDWADLSDPDGDQTGYIWQLAADAGFGTIIFSSDATLDSEVSVPFGTLDSLLLDAEVAVGGSATLYHRVWTSDGSIQTPSQALSVNVTRGTVTSNEGEAINELPREVTLKQNFPNPFNPSTEITFQLPAAQQVSLTVYNLTGREVTTLVDSQRMSAGTQTVTFNAANLASGVYIYRLETPERSLTRKMVLIK